MLSKMFEGDMRTSSQLGQVCQSKEAHVIALVGLQDGRLALPSISHKEEVIVVLIVGTKLVDVPQL